MQPFCEFGSCTGAVLSVALSLQQSVTLPENIALRVQNPAAQTPSRHPCAVWHLAAAWLAAAAPAPGSGWALINHPGNFSQAVPGQSSDWHRAGGQRS